jgi:SAM-dependent methyltransferase
MAVIYKKMKYLSGLIVYSLSSKNSRKKIREDFSIGSLLQPNTLFEKLARFYLAEKNSRKKNKKQLASLHQEFWKGRSGRKFHEITRKNAAFKLNENFSAVIAIARYHVQRYHLKNLVEIGCGNGEVLRYLAGLMSDDIEHFIGLDLSLEQIQANNGENNNDKIKYIHADVDEWIRGWDCNDSLFMTHRGVLEYFTEEMVNRLFRRLANGCNCVLLIEPIDHAVNLDLQTSSHVFGMEYSFSHNYPEILKQNKFKILHLEDKTVDRWRTLMIFAATGIDCRPYTG